MSQVTIVDNEYVTLVYLPGKGMLYHTIHKPLAGQAFRDALNAGTAAMKEYGICKWLSDDRKNGELSAEDANWGATDWNRRTIAAGWKYWAVVVPEEIIAADSLASTIMNLAEQGLYMMVFSNLEDAFNWLDKRET